MQDTILIIDFGSQYTQLIARRVRELQVYSEICPFNRIPEINDRVKGVILSGSPYSVNDRNAPVPLLEPLLGKIPLLGICYGAQFIAKHFGGHVRAGKTREYGRARLNYIDRESKLLSGVELQSQVWMSHGDSIEVLPPLCKRVAGTSDVDVAAYAVKEPELYGLQFHPEVYHTASGLKILRNFVVHICGCSQNWNASSFIRTAIETLKHRLSGNKVILGLSGGVDSSVAAMLLHRAVGAKLFCIFVDNGLLRKNEFQNVLQQYYGMGLNVKGIDASARFYSRLKGISDPEAKRKAIGTVFIEVFEEEAGKIQNVTWLAQGTIYPDVIESKSVNGPSATIKSHHNVGGLPEKMNLKIIEPLSNLFKDEVRKVGSELGIPDLIMKRHPFPGPGLAIRILGEVTPDKVRTLQQVDHIFINGLLDAGIYNDIWQAGAILLPVQSVGVMGDERTYEHVVALRAVTSTDGMTADWCDIPHEILSRISNDIINKVKGVNRVVYDISSKPPATIEWE